MTGCAPGFSPSRDLAEAPLAGDHVRGVLARHGELELSRFIGELIRTLMSALMDDVLAETRAGLARGQSRQSAADVRGVPAGAGRLFRRRCWRG